MLNAAKVSFNGAISYVRFVVVSGQSGLVLK